VFCFFFVGYIYILFNTMNNKSSNGSLTELTDYCNGDIWDTSPPENNKYVTWSVSLLKAVTSMKITELDATPIAIDSDGNDKTLQEIAGKVTPIQFDPVHLAKFKDFDLGGGDQKKIKDAIKEKKNLDDADKGSLKKYGKNLINLLTGGTDASRRKNLMDMTANTNGFISSDKSFALKLDMETKLTAASIYDHVKQKNLKNVLVVPVGSTDAHFILFQTIGANFTVKCWNVADWNNDTTNKISTIFLKSIPYDINHIIFGGSFQFGLGDNKHFEGTHTYNKIILRQPYKIKDRSGELVDNKKGKINTKLLEYMITEDNTSTKFSVELSDRGINMDKMVCISNEAIKNCFAVRVNAPSVSSTNTQPSVAGNNPNFIMSGGSNHKKCSKSRRKSKSNKSQRKRKSSRKSGKSKSSRKSGKSHRKRKSSGKNKSRRNK
jgi:hypothetical protein